MYNYKDYAVTSEKNWPFGIGAWRIISFTTEQTLLGY